MPELTTTMRVNEHERMIIETLRGLTLAKKAEPDAASRLRQILFADQNSHTGKVLQNWGIFTRGGGK